MKVLSRIEAWISFSLLMAALFLGLVQIVLREAFSGGFVWADGMLVLLTVWAALFAAAVGVDRGAHISLDLLVSRLSGNGRRVLQTLILLLTLLFVAMIVMYSVRFEISIIQTGIESITTYIPQWIEFACVPIAMTLMGVHLAVQVVRLWVGA